MPTVQSAGVVAGLHASWYPGGVQAAGGVRLYEGVYQDYAAIWRTQPNVRTVVGFLARNIAQLGLHIYDQVSDAERLRITDGVAARWLRSPTGSRKVSLYDLIDWFVHDLCVFDDAYWLKVETEGRVATLPLLPQLVEPIGGHWLEPEFYRVAGARGDIDLPADSVVHIHGYNPTNRRAGVSPMETLRRILAEDESAGRYREQFWERGARFESVIERPREAPAWSETARGRFRTDWQALYSGQGPQAGSTPILEDGMALKEASHNAKDSEYIAARKLTRQEVASAFYVLPAMVGIMEHANFANIREQHRATYQDTLGPIMAQLSAAFDLQLAEELRLPESAFFEFNIRDKMRGNFEEEARSLQSATGAPHMTRNEARARQGLAPIEGGDELIVPLNVLSGGQASPTDAGLQNVRSRGAKALDPQVATETERLRQMLVRYFGRQQAVVLTQVGALSDPTLEQVLDRARWDDELTADLFASALTTARRSGRTAADVLDDELEQDIVDADGITEALEESSRGMAVEINDWTSAHLADALTAEDRIAATREVFGGLLEERAGVYAQSRTTTVWNFAFGAAAGAVGAATKTWVVNSGNPRPEHAEMDGETVGISERFSNGARWPGDPALPVSERANCNCSIDVARS